MPRLPQIGGDSGTWGSVLNDFLTNEHNADGSHKDVGVIATKYVKPGSGIPKSDLSSAVQASLDNADAAVAGTAPDATTSTKGVVQLAGDLSGTAASPSIATGSITDAKVASGAAIAQSKIANLTTDLAAKETPAGAQDKVDDGVVEAKSYADDAVAAHAADPSVHAYMPVEIVWNGSSYQPASVLSLTSKRKVFIGPTDPSTVSGVVLSVNDEWKRTN